MLRGAPTHEGYGPIGEGKCVGNDLDDGTVRFRSVRADVAGCFVGCAKPGVAAIVAGPRPLVIHRRRGQADDGQGNGVAGRFGLPKVLHEVVDRARRYRPCGRWRFDLADEMLDKVAIAVLFDEPAAPPLTTGLGFEPPQACPVVFAGIDRDLDLTGLADAFTAKLPTIEALGGRRVPDGKTHVLMVCAAAFLETDIAAVAYAIPSPHERPEAGDIAFRNPNLLIDVPDFRYGLVGKLPIHVLGGPLCLVGLSDLGFEYDECKSK